MNQRQKKTGSRFPFVFLNMAMTADGKIATTNRAVHSFGSARDLRHLYELRATADAILCGARTVEISEATLGNGGTKYGKLRLKNGLAEFPVRVVVTGNGTLNPTAKIFQTHSSPLLILTTRRASARKLATIRSLADEVKIAGKNEVDLTEALLWLKQTYGVKRLLCEGGGELNDALIRADLVDEIHLTICPKIMGGRTAPTISGGVGFANLELTRRFRLLSARVVQGELFTRFGRLLSSS